MKTNLSDALAALVARPFLVVTGKGGVGKSTAAAVLGRVLSDAGQRVLVVEVDARESLHQLFGRSPSGGEVVAVSSRLAYQHLKPAAVVDLVVAEQVRLGAVIRRLRESPVYQHFVEGAPGLRELAILEHARRLAARAGFDTVVLDAPASGHSVSLLAAPVRVAEAVRGGPFGRLAGELAAFVADPTRSGVVAVTQAEEMPVQEVLELAERLHGQVGRRPELLVVNGLVPEPATGDLAGEGDGPLTRLWRERAAAERRELARLEASWVGPRLHLPALPLPRGPRLVAALAEGLRSPLGGREA